MRDANSQGEPLQGAADEQRQWPRDFDFREAYAEQRELLEARPERATTSTIASGADRHE